MTSSNTKVRSYCVTCVLIALVVTLYFLMIVLVNSETGPPLEPEHSSSSSLIEDVRDFLHVPTMSSLNSNGLTLQMINVPRTAPLIVHRSYTCPRTMFPNFKSGDGASIKTHMRKYSLYTRQYCNTTGLMQMHFKFPTYIFFLETIATIVQLKHNDKILDWGSGCGTMLNFYQKKFNTTGIGLDVTDEAVSFARKHAAEGNLFCHTDGTRVMSHFKDNTFDAVVSWAALYHVRRTLQQCETVNEMVRVVKPGGVIFLGNLRTDKTQHYWTKRKCHVAGATYAKYSDARVFHISSFKRHGFFSIIVTKNSTGRRLVTYETLNVQRLKTEAKGSIINDSEE